MDMLIKLLMVAAGGALGTICRYLLESTFKSNLITWSINTMGSFLMGLLFGWMLMSSMSAGRKDALYLLLMSGFCGGFSTFAHFAIISVNYFRDGAIAAGVGYVLVTMLAGLVCCFAGFLIGTKI